MVLVSFDAFRWDYAEMYPCPNFDALARNGVKAERMIPCFPTKTFPNHYTLATGLYPDHHGIINNSFYATDLESFTGLETGTWLRIRDSYFGEPIWVTAEKQGIKTASYYLGG